MDKIPGEILSHIFQFIDSANTLATCRRVCKSWNALAVNAMFNNLTIDISHFGRAWNFYDYLLMDVSRGEMVKAINFGYIDITRVELYKRILRMAFTSNMNSIYGRDCCNKFFEEIVHIAKNDMNGGCNLQVIPYPASNATIKYEQEALPMFRDSLQDVYLVRTFLAGPNAIANSVDFLAQFPKLISFAVNIRDDDELDTLMKIIAEMPKIKELTLYYTPSTKSNADPLLYRMQDSTSNVVKLRVFTVKEEYIYDILPHFTNLNSIEFHLDVDDIHPNYFSEIITMLKAVPHYVFEFTIDDRFWTLQSFLEHIPDDVDIDSVSKCECECEQENHEAEWIEEFNCYIIKVKH